MVRGGIPGTASICAPTASTSRTGFAALELDGLLGPAAGNTDPDDASAVQPEAMSRLGDVWLMGRHRLMCGDCTDAAAAMAGNVAAIALKSAAHGPCPIC